MSKTTETLMRVQNYEGRPRRINLVAEESAHQADCLCTLALFVAGLRQLTF